MKVLDFLCTKIAETIAESAILWYNFNMFSKKINQENYTPIQMKFPVDLEKIIEISDPIYTFNEIMEQIDLQKYFVEEGNKMGRPKFDSGTVWGRQTVRPQTVLTLQNNHRI